MTERARAVLLYDGECGFCTLCAEAGQRRIGADVDYQPWQRADLPALGVSPAEAARSIVWVEVDGRLRTGSAAAAALLVSAGGLWAVLGRLLIAPPLAWAAEPAYRLVARYRGRLPGVTPTLQRIAGRPDRAKGQGRQT